MVGEERPFAAARLLAAELWQSNTPRRQIENVLRSQGLSRQQAEIVVAEQAAIDRITAAGLNASFVAREVDGLLASAAEA